jgi:uncharacterized protein (DUF433 family)
MEDIDWSKCEDVERVPGKVSGSWLVKDTRLPVWAILENADDHTPEEIANDIFEGVTPETVRRIIAFARSHAPASTYRRTCRRHASRAKSRHERHARNLSTPFQSISTPNPGASDKHTIPFLTSAPPR